MRSMETGGESLGSVTAFGADLQWNEEAGRAAPGALLFLLPKPQATGLSTFEGRKQGR